MLARCRFVAARVGRYRAVAGGLLCLCAASCGETEAKKLPPLGEVVVSIDTDALVPQMVGRLRIDLFDEQGHWFESRDIARTNTSDWPASFSLFTADLQEPRTVLLRARAYLEGRTREYRGERFADAAPYTEPRVAETLEELCSKMPELTLGQELTMRRGRRTLTGHVPEPMPLDAPEGWAPQCDTQVKGGAVAAKLTITLPGEYRIETTRARPDTLASGDTNLFLRTDCRSALSQIACYDDIDDTTNTSYIDNYLASLITTLSPGSYTVIAAGYFESASDITLRADLASNWNAMAPAAQPQPVGTLPRLDVDDVDTTPRHEPQPLVTIDRLALLKLEPGQKQLARITLRTACGGTMARLSAKGSDGDVVISEAETCIDTERARVKLEQEPLEPFEELPTETLVSTFAVGEACEDGSSNAQAVCIPPGSFVFGSPDEAVAVPQGTVPERYAVMSRFWMDKTEVTVGQWRAALARGFESPDMTPIENNAPLATSNETLNSINGCTYTASPLAAGTSREDFPITCVDYAAARAYCQFQGGDLPTEAQWEYVATKAGKGFESRFPWGDQSDAPSCEHAVFSRNDVSASGPTGADLICSKKGYGIVAVSDPSHQNDVTPLGVVGLAGNASEWVVDSFYSFDSPCWAGSTLTDPVCWEEEAPERGSRGGSWDYDPTFLAGWKRSGGDPIGANLGLAHLGYRNTGFRCAYPEQPE